jgi:poly [ADP-ribose] polymerase
MIDNSIKEIGYDPKKMPLGQLADRTINEAYGILNQLMNELKGSKKSENLSLLASKFYSMIPHDIGFQNTSVLKIDTEE